MKGYLNHTALQAGLMFVVIAALGLSYAQPLLPSSAYVVTATIGGRPTPAELLSPPLMGKLYYVHLLNPSTHRYGSWYGVAFSRQSVFHPIAINTGRGDVYYIHTDQAMGKRLVPGEIGEDSSMVFRSDGVQFTDGPLFVSLHCPR